jgi:phosphoglycolate phosphatase
MEKNTIIFDLDGTLLNTLDDLHACFNYAINSFGYPSRSLEEIRNFVGNGIKKAIERALPHRVEDEELNKIVDCFKSYYQLHMLDLTKPYDGIIDMLTELKEKNYKIAVVSNKFDEAVKKLCKNYYGELVDIAVGEGYKIRKKPEIDGILKVIEIMHSSIQKSIYVGDSEVDIQTANNAKMDCISVLWGFKDKEFLIEHNAKIFAEKPKDIIKIIEKKLYLS